MEKEEYTLVGGAWFEYLTFLRIVLVALRENKKNLVLLSYQKTRGNFLVFCNGEQSPQSNTRLFVTKKALEAS